MAFDRPTLSTLIEQSKADLLGRFPGADSGLRRSVLNVFARVWAAAVHGLYGFIAWIYLQIFIDTADEAGVIQQAGIWNVPRKEPTPAKGPVTFTGTNGAPIGVGARLQREDGLEYLTTEAGEIAGGVATVDVEAVDPGAAGLASAGVALTLTSPIAGVSSAVVVASGGLTGGADQEDIEDWRGRVQARIRKTPQGGAPHDYEDWAKAVPGVTRAWVKPLWMGLGTVGVTFVCDDRVDIIPTVDDVAAVQAAIDAKKPALAVVYVFAPTAKPLNVTVALTPNTAAVQAAVTEELTDLLRREAEPGSTILVSHVREAVSSAEGETDSLVSAPVADVTQLAHEIAVLGVVSF